MTDRPTCPLCGKHMTAIETHPGRGELHCAECDLTIGGNDAKTPDELMAILERGECEMETDYDYLHDGIPDTPEDTWAYKCCACGGSFRYERGTKPNYCPECGRAVKR